MFESAELGHRIEKSRYEQAVPPLRSALLEAQFEMLRAARFPLVILIGGMDGAGKGETVNLLNEWMDPRHIVTHAFGEPSDEERERPPMWRFWRALPPKGKIGILFGSWYSDPVAARVAGESKSERLDQELEEIVRLEKMLTDEGAVLVKFWFHLSKASQKRRLESLEADPETRWRVSDTDWRHYKRYEKFHDIAQRTLRLTSAANAPWQVVEGADFRYRNITVGNALVEAIKRGLEPRDVPVVTAPPAVAPVDNVLLIRSLDLSQKLGKKAYANQLEKYQGKLNRLSRHPGFSKISVIAAFEGFDAAGKGGAIRRVSAALDARAYQIIPVGVPTDEERAQPYLWRFWRHIPRAGRVTIFDRSWYGRVLVERVEKLCPTADWARAYAEINDFEAQLVRNNTVLVKFWLSISQDEQLRRFREREATDFKHFKITPDDWRNREKWGDYELAVCDMVDRTSTEIAPWTLVEAEDKYFGRIKILRSLVSHIEEALDRAG